MGNEFFVLLEVEIEKISAIGSIKAQYAQSIAEAVRRMRIGEVKIKPGYDGEFGKIDIFNEEELSQIQQSRLL